VIVTVEQLAMIVAFVGFFVAVFVLVGVKALVDVRALTRENAERVVALEERVDALEAADDDR
jgi:hypothetical protein